MADENTPETPVVPHEETPADSPEVPQAVSVGSEPDSVPASVSDETEDASRLRTRNLIEARDRVRFLSWLGLDDDASVALYHRMRLAQAPVENALRGETPSDRIVRLKREVEGRLRSLPRFAYPEFRKRYQINQRVKTTSDVFRDLGEDADDLARALCLSGEIIAELSDKLFDQMALHEELSVRLDAVRAIEEKVINSPLSWTLEVARMIESVGFDRNSIRSKGKQIVDDIAEVLMRHGGPVPGAEGTFERMAERVVYGIDAGSDDDDLRISDSKAFDDAAVFPMDAVEPLPFMADLPSDGSTGIARKLEPSRIVDAFFAGDVGAKTASDPNPDAAGSGGFAMIDGLSNEHRFEGMYSQFERGEPSPINPNRMARIEERSVFGMPSVSLVDGVLPDAAWLRYEFPYGDYVLLQMRGSSRILPRLRDTEILSDTGSGMVSGMLPPYVSMVRYGEMIGASEKDLRGLAAWDNQGEGLAHLRPAVLDGNRGDPVQAYEVMKRAVAIHLASVLGSDEAGRISPVAQDHLARFWLFLVVGRMRPGQLELLWPGGFFHGVEGHDVGLGNEGHVRLLRLMGGSIDAAIA